jgi:hypothetical protein
MDGTYQSADPGKHGETPEPGDGDGVDPTRICWTQLLRAEEPAEAIKPLPLPPPPDFSLIEKMYP